MRVLVLDARSHDRTAEFARAAGAEVVERDWTDFVEARRYALGCVRTPWAFMLDADEALDDVLCSAVVDASDDATAYIVRRTTYFCGRPLRMWRNEPLLRLFRPDRVRLEAQPAAGGTAALHERWISDAPPRELAGTLLHFSYPDRASYLAKYDRYTSVEAAGAPPSLARAASATAVALPRALWLLTGKGAILDGWRGAYVAAFSAAYPAVVAWKSMRR